MDVAATHYLKCWPEYFREVRAGRKPFEIRKNDRDFQVGDRLVLQEFIPRHRWIEQYTGDGYTGEEITREITYITDYEQQPGFVVLGLKGSVGDAVSRKAINDLVKSRLNKVPGYAGFADDIEDPFHRGKAQSYENILYDINVKLPIAESGGEAAKSQTMLETAKEALSAVTSECKADRDKLQLWADSVEKEARHYLRERNEAQAEISEADGWCEYWRREAFRKYPTPEAYEAACKALEKHRAENERQQAALARICSTLEHSRWHGTNYIIWKLATEALSTSETAVQPAGKERIRDKFDRLDNYFGGNDQRAEDYRNGMLWVIQSIGIEIPGISTSESGRETDAP